MNKARRSMIDSVISQLNELRDIVDDLYNQEEEAYYNLPEGLQVSDRGFAMEEAYGNLANASGSIDEAIESLESAKQ